MKKSRLVWLKAGYRLFGKEGKPALNIDRLAKFVGKARSSFYHNFYNLTVFEESLFEYHYQETKRLSAKAQPIDSMFPDYINLLANHKHWLFFQKQLYLLRLEDEKFQKIFDRARNLTEDKSAALWSKYAGLDKLPLAKVREFYLIIREGLYARLDYENYSAEVLTKELEDTYNSFRFLLTRKKTKTA